MKKKYIMICLSIFTIFLYGCGNKKDLQKENTAGVEDNKDIDNIGNMLDNMTLEEKIGQLLIVGFEGQDIDSYVMNYIDDINIGGLIFFKRNLNDYEQILNMVNNIKEYNKDNIPLFLSIDEEGGLVSRMPDEFVRLPDAILLENKPEMSRELGHILGSRLSSIGMNLNFAPVMDINSNTQNPVIGNRATGTTKETVKKNTLGIIEAMKEEKIMAVGKHFPGHGDTRVDSHLELPIIDKSKEDLFENEIEPFKYNIDHGLDGLMVGHLLMPSLDSRPATISEIILNDILRDELNYNGLIFSDDMTMGAVTKSLTIEEGAVEFLLSGGDQVLLCHGLDLPMKVKNLMLEKIKIGAIEESKIDEKVYRILKTKEKYGLDNEKIETRDLEELNNRTLRYIEKVGG